MAGKTSRQTTKGFSLVEVMVALVVLSILIIFAAASITQSRKALSQAEYIQVATAYATDLIEESKASPPMPSELPKTDLDQDVTVGQKTFHVARSIYQIDALNDYENLQIVVRVTWNTCARPLVFSEVILVK
ncbi:MAG: prepilin-type N-terminal cleavage/methylation domain-containing protein [Candidatus Eremiobacteraeota bacterium]|nr:prepilin-type N-terminal cleavage/methylation domain-containing protein [Candidatus Eremiobacteraeota bacterium]